MEGSEVTLVIIYSIKVQIPSTEVPLTVKYKGCRTFCIGKLHK